MTLRAEVHEGGLQAGFHPGDFCFVNARFLLLAGTVFNVEIVEFLAVDQCNPNFFGLGGVNQHSFHVLS